MGEAPMSAPELGEDPWEISRPNLRIGPHRQATVRETLWRAVQISYLAIWYVAYSYYLKVKERDFERRRQLRAEKLRIDIQALGGMLVKLGQQLSMRMDLLPKVYCDELKKLLDTSDEFPFEQAIAAIELQIRKPWGQVFEQINRKPVGCASIACVYDARLKSGHRVAIKVRRPGIVHVFATDFRALKWTVSLLEFLARMRPGVLRNFEKELYGMFQEELDFRIEGRYQELFRHYLKKRKDMHTTAPRVFHELSGHDVLVSEFVTGVQVKTIGDAVVRGDQKYLAYLKELDIRPKVIAQRLIRVSHYTFQECPFFHADPHSANIFIQPRNKIVLVDFGACGVFSAGDRAWMWQMQEFYLRGDVAGMVQCVLGVMEPLPPMDVDQFKSELLQEWWHGYYGIQSKHAEWWERTSFRLWLALLNLFFKYQLPMPFNLLRMIRATLLYDTVAAQLYPRINVFTEFQKYQETVAIRAKERLFRSVVCQLLTGPTPKNCLVIEQGIQTGKDFLFRAQQLLRQASFNFVTIPAKIFEVIRIGLMFFRAVVMATVAVAGMVTFVSTLVSYRTTGSLRFWDAANWNTLRVIIMISVLVSGGLLYLYGRRLSYRLLDPDNYSERRGS